MALGVLVFDRDLDCFRGGEMTGALPVHVARPGTLAALLGALPAAQASYANACGFAAACGAIIVLPGEGQLGGAVLGLGDSTDPRVFGALATGLPAGHWHLGMGVDDAEAAVLGWALGAYRFDLLKLASRSDRPLLVLPAGEHAAALRAARATWLARDLINTPANLLGPGELAVCAQDVLTRRGAHVEVITGEDVGARYPALAAVGRGSLRPPLVVVARWQPPDAPAGAPLVSICGKGVCFDTGGYDIKPSAGMLRMKKDMGGAAVALGLACMIIEAGLPVRLEIRLGCAENMISGNAMRPSDVLETRSGLRVEVGNTDAEGRLLLCDLLTEACEGRPDMLLDFATLTGAARVALGPDLPALFSNNEGLANLFLDSGGRTRDPMWRLPLWDGYNSWLESNTADLNNVTDKPLAGAITAALFLQRFVSEGTRWAHFDVYAWNDAPRPGAPAGGEAQTMRAAFEAVSSFAGNQGTKMD